MSKFYSFKNFRSDAIIGLVLLGLSIGAVHSTVWKSNALLGAAQMMIVLFGALGGLAALARASYEGSTLLYRRSPDKRKPAVQVIVVTLAWMLALSQFAPGASLSRLEVSLSGWAFVGGVVLFLWWLARAATTSSQAQPRMRAYLMTLAFLMVLLGPARYGYTFGSRDEENSNTEQPERSPSHLKDSALLHFLLYSAACFIGVAGAKSKQLPPRDVLVADRAKRLAAEARGPSAAAN